jgi:hypothetical protein
MTGNEPALIHGLAAITTRAFQGEDLTALWQSLADRVTADATDAAALFDLSIICQLGGDRDRGLAFQREALTHQRVYRLISASGGERLRVLALMGPGDFMANTPLEFLIQDSDVALDLLYVVPGLPFPAKIPEHDLAFMAIGEADATRGLLGVLEPLVRAWPRPILNRPECVLRLSRLGTWTVLDGAPGIAMPKTVRVDRAAFAQIGAGAAPLDRTLPGDQFPIIARPIGSHAGRGLAKLDSASAIAPYLAEQPGDAFTVSRFVDYRSPDGLFRKYRVAMIGGRPFASHMAISTEWMVHYLNAGMTESAEKRAEEARFMADFDTDFGHRHAAAFHEFAERAALDYFAIDCGETPDGKLLVFEADTAMIVHSMDPPDMFPYKPPQMRKLFAAFLEMLAGAVRPAT